MAYFSLEQLAEIPTQFASVAQLFGPWTLHRCTFKTVSEDIELTPVLDPSAEFTAVDIRNVDGCSSSSGWHFASAVSMHLQQWKTFSLNWCPVVFFNGTPVASDTPFSVEYSYDEDGLLRPTIRFHASVETTKEVRALGKVTDGFFENVKRKFANFYSPDVTETLMSVVSHFRAYCKRVDNKEKLIVVDDGTSFVPIRYTDLDEQTARAIIPDVVADNIIGISSRSLQAAVAFGRHRCVLASAHNSAHNLQMTVYQQRGQYFIRVVSSSYQKTLLLRMKHAIVKAAFSPSGMHVVLFNEGYTKITVVNLDDVGDSNVFITDNELKWDSSPDPSMKITITQWYADAETISIWLVPTSCEFQSFHSYMPGLTNEPPLPVRLVRHGPHRVRRFEKCDVVHQSQLA